MLVSKPAAGASQAALDFIGNQQRAMLARQTLRSLGKRRAQRTDAAFTLDKLKTNRANGIVKAAFQVGNVVELHEVDAGKPRVKRRPVFFLVRGRQRAEGASMKRVLQRKNPELGSDAV